jgi:5-(carboxyamino)imidazole ribonucleotide mutase
MPPTSGSRASRSDLAARFVALAIGAVFAGFGVLVIASWLGAPLWLAGVLASGLAIAMGGQLFGRSTPRRAIASEAGATIVATEGSREDTMGESPLVGIIMGSTSDMTVMEECAKTLESLGVPYEVLVASAHRQPEKVHEWASSAAGRGIKVIVAAAGKAAHLGGVVAAFTPLPVITVPMKTSDLGGLDSLLSMVQMPSGVPVACVAINGAKNAAILATQILGTATPAYREAIERMKADLAAG